VIGLHGHIAGVAKWVRDGTGHKLRHADFDLCRKFAKNAIDAMLQ
jgi:hypothetical protein